MLSSALIGCFTVRLISFAHRKETQVKYIFQYFLAQLYRRVIILYIKCGHQGAAINMLAIETAFKCTIDFYFHFWDRTNSVYTMERQYLPYILQDQMLVSGALDR